jgi:hypothetical protein
VRQAIRLLLSGECKTIKAAAVRVKIDYSHLSEQLRKPAARVFMEQRTRETIVSAQMPAASTLVRLLNARSEHVQADVAKYALAIAGIAPPQGSQVTVNVDVSPGFVINLGEGPLLQHEPQREAKALENKDDVPSER